MKKLLQLTLLLFFISVGNIMAQMKPGTKNRSSATESPIKRFFTKTPWTFGISGHVVEDDGKSFTNLFNVGKSWNFLPYPTRLTIDGYYKSGFSFQGEFAYNQYKSGKDINSEIISNTWTFFSADINVKYDLNEVFGPTNWFDPYVAAGHGYTLRTGAPKPNTVTFNMGLGANFMIWENLGFNLQSMAKFSMIEGTSNYLHHSVGVVYRIEGGHGRKPGKLGNRYKFMNRGRR
jgi:OmpA-OmpF porin, OOP family